MSHRFIALAPICGALLAGAAHAQSLGNYSGMQANGAGINMTITTDSVTGKPEITGFGYGVVTNACKPSGSINTGWGVGPNVDFNNNTAKFTIGASNPNNNGGPYVYVTATVTVSGTSASGTITTASPSFATYTHQPHKAIFCLVPKQSFTMTYQGTAPLRMPAHTTYIQ